MHRESISIIIPTYQSGSHIKELLNNLYLSFEVPEIIIVDDASTDTTWEQIGIAAKSSNNLKAYRLNKNVGQHRCLLFGIQQSSRDYILTIDDDMSTLIPTLRTFVDKAYAVKKDVVYASFDRVHGTNFRRLGSKVLNWILTSSSVLFSQASQLRILRSTIRDSLQSKTTDQFLFMDSLLHEVTSSFGSLQIKIREGASSRYSAIKLVGITLKILLKYTRIVTALMILTGVFMVIFAFSLKEWVLGFGILPMILSQKAEQVLRKRINIVTPFMIFETIEK